MPAAIPIAFSAAVGAMGTAAPMVTGAVAWSTSQVLIGTAIGAAVGSLGLLLQPDRPGSGSSARGHLQTTSLRNRPVPVVFGTVRAAGNYIALGNFHTYKDAADGTPGLRLRQMNAVMGLCEGPVQRIEQILVDGKTIAKQIEEVELPERFTLFPMVGGAREGLSNWLASATLRKKYGFDTIVDPVPWRNTAKIVCGVNVGSVPRLADISARITGPDYSIRRSGTVADSNQQDVFAHLFYDGHTEAFYGTMSASARTGPLGLLRVPRERHKTTMTLPPESVTQNVQRAWYLGRHDVLVMQDPSDDATFHIGCWGMARAGGWETVNPDPAYANPMLHHHLDELHGMLHSLHSDGETLYVMQWHLLTGRITRVYTEIEDMDVRHFAYAPDQDGYLIGSRANLYFADRASGLTYHSTDRLSTWKAKGVCATGAFIGAVHDAGIIYYDPKHRKMTKRYGSSDAGDEPGHFGGITQAVQNTWTGHVTAVKYTASGWRIINFIPAFPDMILSYPVKKVPRTVTKLKRVAGAMVPQEIHETVYDEKQVEEKLIDEVGGVARDWSVREPVLYRLRSLQGESSVAGAMWNALVDEAGNDSARWGAGLSGGLVSLSSFESVHAHCVGPVLYPYKRINRYQERYKFDYLLDAERSVADLLANEILLAINGFRTLIDGRLHIGVQRSALASSWHFTEHQILEDSAQMVFLGRPSGMNRARVEFPDSDDSYRRDFGEANDEYDQDVRGRVVSTTLAGNGISRLGHAQALAQQMIDAVAGNRRQITFKTSWIGFVLSCGDGIEVTSESLGLSRTRFRVTRIEEDENNEVRLTAVEHLPVRDILRPDNGAVLRNSDCALFAESAEYRGDWTMSPMHLGVYEDVARMRLVPMAALSPATRKAASIRVDYRFDDGGGWSGLGSMDSTFGGMLLRGVSTRGRSLTLECVHGDPDRQLEGDVPVVISRHEGIGEQHARSGGDEVGLAYHFDGATNTLAIRRPAPQAWLTALIPPAKVYRVHGVSEDGACFQNTMYLPLLHACTGEASGLHVAAESIPYFPFHLKVDSTLYRVMESGATDEPSLVVSTWSESSRFPLVLEMTVGGTSGCGDEGTFNYEASADWVWSSGDAPWQLAMVANLDGSVQHWEIRQSATCRYKLVGSEGACSPVGSWNVTAVDASGCGDCSMNSAFVSITES